MWVVRAEPGDACDYDDHCENGGTCEEADEQHTHKYCHCADGFAGIRCHDFCPKNCQNGSYCRYHEMAEPHRFDKDRDPDDYVCQCFGLFEGDLCEISYMNCGDGTRCYNGGVCRHVEVIEVHEDNSETTITEKICDCPPGYGGPTCQGPPDEPTMATRARLSMLPSGRKNKTAVFFGLLFGFVLLSFFSWWLVTYVQRKCAEAGYSAVEVVGDTDETATTQSPQSFRNVV